MIPTTILGLVEMSTRKTAKPFEVVAKGELASKSNSRRIVRIGGRVRVVKSSKAVAIGKSFALQNPPRKTLLEGDVHLDIDIYYASRRPDLDESLLLDLLQGVLYKNDRQVRSRRVRWGIDKNNPRMEVRARLMEPSDYAPGHTP